MPAAPRQNPPTAPDTGATMADATTPGGDPLNNDPPPTAKGDKLKPPTTKGGRAKAADVDDTGLKDFACHIPADPLAPRLTVKAKDEANAREQYKKEAGIIGTMHPIQAAETTPDDE